MTQERKLLLSVIYRKAIKLYKANDKLTTFEAIFQIIRELKDVPNLKLNLSREELAYLHRAMKVGSIELS